MMTVALSDLYLQWVFTAKALEDEVVEDFLKEGMTMLKEGREMSEGRRALQVEMGVSRSEPRSSRKYDALNGMAFGCLLHFSLLTR